MTLTTPLQNPQLHPVYAPAPARQLSLLPGQVIDLPDHRATRALCDGYGLRGYEVQRVCTRNQAVTLHKVGAACRVITVPLWLWETPQPQSGSL